MKRALYTAGLFFAISIFAPTVSPARAATSRAPTKAEVETVVESMRRVLKDPYSVRDAAISNVGTYDNGFGQAGNFICFRFNAKNQFGAYVGLKTVLAVFDANGSIGKPPGLLSSRSLCASVPFRPFKELDRLKTL